MHLVNDMQPGALDQKTKLLRIGVSLSLVARVGDYEEGFVYRFYFVKLGVIQVPSH